MAAKYLHSLADENPDLKKQLGCMTGVFQAFNRHHIVSGRHLIGHSPKRVRSGSLLSNNGTPERESNVEKHRVSTESSKESFSWSPPSPFSYVDYNIDRRPHQEPDDLSGCRQMNHQNLDLRDVVKDSMYREARGLSHKTVMKKESPNNMLNYREAHNVLNELGEADWYCDEPRDLWRSKSCHIKDGFSFSLSKDYPRFSYDGRETDRLCIKSGETSKTTPKKSNEVNELPRLSLDSKERSIRTLSSVSLVPIKSSDSKNSNINGGVSADKSSIPTRPPNVVAKLMGLETFADSASTSYDTLDVGPFGSHLVDDTNSSSKSPKATDVCGSIKIPNSTGSSSKEPTSPCWKNHETKLVSRVPIEPAPWKKRDGPKSPHKPSPRATRLSTERHSPVSSVYGEVDKRLNNLEFSQSGKDLRALKQILAAMQAVEARKGEKQDEVDCLRNHEMSLNEHQNPPSPSSRSDVSMAHETHIVIMKPGKIAGKSFPNNKTGKDPITTASKPRKQSECRSPNTRQRRPSNTEQGDDQVKEIEARKFSYRENRTSQQVNGNKLSKMDTETNASGYSEETNSRQSSSSIHEKSTLLVKMCESPVPEYPSPVSVLDDSVYTDNSPSPVKRTPNTPKDDSTETLDKEIVKDRYEATNNVISNTINRERLKKIELLVQKLKKLNSTHDETHTDYIASLCENTNPNNRYISEVFLASGLLLQDLESFEFHSSGHPINPDLFLVLEHTKFSNLKNKKFHRKLIFDAINEFLVAKLNSTSKTLQNPRKLLRESCMEIERQMVRERVRCDLGKEDDDLKSILREDVLSRSENWIGFHGESPAIAVEVERLVFRELVDELFMCEV